MVEWSWSTGLHNYFDQLIPTLETTKPEFEKKTRNDENNSKFTIRKFIKKIQNKELRKGTVICIKGLFSEFVPILSMHLLFPGIFPTKPPDELTLHTFLPGANSKFSIPLRIESINNIGIAGLYEINSEGVYDPCVPIFYNKKEVKLPKDLTGKIIEARVKIIELPTKWKQFFISNDLIEYKIQNHKKNYGFFLEDLKILNENNTKFFVDLWRMDYFSLNDYNPREIAEEEMFEFYHLDTNFKNWPNIFEKFFQKYAFVLAKDILRRRITSFGVLPRINILNTDEVLQARKNLKNFYQYGYEQSTSNGNWRAQQTFGHGIFHTDIYKKAKTVFQVDQIDPILKQEFDLKKL